MCPRVQLFVFVRCASLSAVSQNTGMCNAKITRAIANFAILCLLFIVNDIVAIFVKPILFLVGYF